jgi:hypothetical protein
MPQISYFLGIVIRMYYRDHNPPHFHAIYGEDEGIIDIERNELMAGDLPERVLGFVKEWSAIHQSELMENNRLPRAGCVRVAPTCRRGGGAQTQDSLPPAA